MPLSNGAASPLLVRPIVVGGQITVFTKPDCPYCKVVVSALQSQADKVLLENREAKLWWKIIDCSFADNVALCARLTGKLSVPHVFFNDEYVGNHDFTVALCRHGNETDNLVLRKLREMSVSRQKQIACFPPIPDATVVKVSARVALALSPPNEKQLGTQASRWGFKTVICLEGMGTAGTGLDIDLDQQERLVTESGLRFVHLPIMMSVGEEDAALQRAKEAVALLNQVCEWPALVHGGGVGLPTAVLVCLLLSEEDVVGKERDELRRLGKLHFGVDVLPPPPTQQQPQPSPATSKRVKCEVGSLVL